MEVLSFLRDKNSELAHFYIIEGARGLPEAALLAALESRGISTRGNPEVLVLSYESFLIEHAQDLRAKEKERGSDAQTFFIVSALSYAHEAQQALLKMFEEPRQDAHFFVIVPKAEHLLDTVRSRGALVRMISAENTDTVLLAKELLKATPAERLEKIKKLIASHEDDDTSGALREFARTLTSALARVLSESKTPRDYSSHDVFVFEEFLKAEKFLINRGAGVKMILEHLMLII